MGTGHSRVENKDQQAGLPPLPRLCFVHLQSVFLSFFSDLEIEIPGNCLTAFEAHTPGLGYQRHLVLLVINFPVGRVTTKRQADPGPDLQRCG